MRADPLFVDLRIALENARPICRLIAERLDILTKLRGFRHVARNAYAHQFDHDRLVSNARIAVELLPILAADIDALESYMLSDPSGSAP